jgi:dihydrofolate reductase
MHFITVQLFNMMYIGLKVKSLIQKIMRKLIILSFMSLDGVMQAPGGPEEDTSGGFKYGGWTFPYFDEFMGEEMTRQMSHDFDMLLGRKTYEIFAAYWPFADTARDPIAEGINKARKYVVSGSLEKLDWSNSYLIKGKVPDEIRKLKEGDGPEIQVHGSGNLIQTLWRNDLADELWLKIFPVAVGSGKRLFADEKFAGSFDLVQSKISPTGVIIANYKRAGVVKRGSFV